MRCAALSGALATAFLTFSALPAIAQHATESDISDGERAFADNCANCHGPDGNLIAGIDFGRGLLRRDYGDAELVGIIMNGIPDTPMPATPGMSVEQAERIVAYLRAWPGTDGARVRSGDPDRGREVFFGKGDCLSCHAIRGVGARHGPDLSRIGLERRAVEIEASLLDPAAFVQPTGRSFEVTLANGDVVTGRLLNHDTFTVQLVDTDDRLRSFVKADLRSYGFVDTPMPSYRGVLSSQEIADLVSFLTSQQGFANE
jgi:putative heme-binding domain-containing protein